MNQHSTPTEEHPSALSEQLDGLIVEAENRSKKTSRWARFWQVTDITLGLATAVLAAIAGATGLASTAGRVPAAILALIAAGLTAASKFLESRARYERNRKRRNALEALERDAQFAKASQGWPGAESLYDALRRLNDRWTVIMNMDHDPVPPEALGQSEAQRTHNNPSLADSTTRETNADLLRRSGRSAAKLNIANVDRLPEK